LAYAAKLPHPGRTVAQPRREGDCRAFKHLYEQYWHKLCRAAYGRLRDRETAQELVQEIFAKLWMRRADLRVEKSLDCYLYRSLRYEVMNHCRAVAVRQRYARQYRRSTSARDEATLHLLSFNELNDRMQKEINKLPEKCRAVFELSRHQGYSTVQIAEALNISPKTVEVHHIGSGYKLRHVHHCFGVYNPSGFVQVQVFAGGTGGVRPEYRQTE
jgi:RNA polymerase sigma-70 factor (ECF subfamily)